MVSNWFSFARKARKIFLLHEHVQIFSHGSTLRNKSWETGVRKRTLMKSSFVYASYCGSVVKTLKKKSLNSC